MTKTQEVSSADPLAAFGFGRTVLSDGARGMRLLVRLANWLAGFRAECHLSCAAGPDDWNGGGEPPALSIVASGTLRRPVATDFWISKDAALALNTVNIGIECNIQAGNEITVIWSITGSNGTVTSTHVLTDADNGTESLNTMSINSATDGDEWVLVEITVELTSGASSTSFVKELNFEEGERDTSSTGVLPDPENS